MEESKKNKTKTNWQMIRLIIELALMDHHLFASTPFRSFKCNDAHWKLNKAFGEYKSFEILIPSLVNEQQQIVLISTHNRY